MTERNFKSLFMKSYRTEDELLAASEAGDGVGPICYPAAFDTASQKGSVSKETYDAYMKFHSEEHRRGEPIPGGFEDMQRRIAEDLGGGTICGRRVTTKDELAEVLREAETSGSSVVMYTNPDHVVGIKPTKSGRLRMVGKAPPVSAPVKPDTAFSRLLPVEDTNPGANVHVFTPDKKKSTKR